MLASFEVDLMSRLDTVATIVRIFKIVSPRHSGELKLTDEVKLAGTRGEQSPGREYERPTC